MITPWCTEHPPVYSWYPHCTHDTSSVLNIPQCTEHPPVYCTPLVYYTDIMQGDHSFSHFKIIVFSFRKFIQVSHYAKYSEAKCSFTGLQITVFILSRNKFCSVCKLQLLFFCLKIQVCSFCKVQFSHFGKYSSSRFLKNSFTCFRNCSFFSCHKILSEYQWKTGTLFILTFAKCANCCPTL